MNQVKIGSFIARCRKEQNLTQAQLAEKLNITDRAISKWETGRAMPDSSLMIELCNILNISVNELLIGEKIEEQENDTSLQQLVLDMVKDKQQSDKRMLKFEAFLGITLTIVFFVLILLAALTNIDTWLRVLLMVFAFAVFLAGCFVALRIEQVAGYYQCKECGHSRIPTYKEVTMAPHMGRTRKMKCPHCNKKTWQKKIIEKE